ncbi:phage major tail protein, TP901-1 family [Pseudoroseicyclus sp. H15]
MAKQKGRELLIKIGDGQETEAFTTVCGLTSKTLGINNNDIDITTPNCDAPGGALWRELMEGIKSLTLSGNGVFEDTPSEITLLNLAMSPTPTASFQAIVPHLGTFEGAFLLSSMEYAGEMEGAVTYSMSLSSSGKITFTADPTPDP